MENRFVLTSFFDIFVEYLASNNHVAPDIVRTIDGIKKQYPHQAPEKSFTSVFSMIETQFPKPALSFRIGIAAEAKHYGVIGYMATTCATLQQALMRCLPYQGLIENSMDAKIIDQDTNIKLKWWRNNSAINRDECEIGIAAFVNFYQLLIGSHIPPVFIELPFESTADTQIYEAIIGCPVKFNADCVSITLPKNLLLKDISTSDPYLRSLYERQAKALLDKEKTDDQFLQKTRQAIQAQLFDNPSNAEVIATQVGLSLRTFYRQLNKYGLRYRTLLADTRLSLAKTYLADKRLSLAEISLMLGYSDQSAFTRAFVSWTGITPSKFRQSEFK
jgi:AraC-like DNA-binding protein